MTDDLVRRAAINRGRPPGYSYDAACERHDYLDSLLSRLLVTEAMQRCDQCGAGDCTHQAAQLVLEERAQHSERYAWDRACRRGISYQGYGLDELLCTLLLREADKTCSEPCRTGDCTHEAARRIVAEMRAQPPVGPQTRFG